MTVYDVPVWTLWFMSSLSFLVTREEVRMAMGTCHPLTRRVPASDGGWCIWWKKTMHCLLTDPLILSVGMAEAGIYGGCKPIPSTRIDQTDGTHTSHSINENPITRHTHTHTLRPCPCKSRINHICPTPAQPCAASINPHNPRDRDPPAPDPKP